MEENRNIFDDHLNDALKGLNGEVNPSDWEMISSALDRMDASEAEFDQTLKETASRFTGNVTEGDWKNVSSAIARKRRRVIAMWWSIAGLLVISGGLWFLSDMNRSNDFETGTIPSQQEQTDLNHAIIPENVAEKQEVVSQDDKNISQFETTDQNVPETPSTPLDILPGDNSTVSTSNRDEAKSLNEIVYAERNTQQIHTLDIKNPLLNVNIGIPEWGGQIVINRSSLGKAPALTFQNPATWEFGVRITPNVGLLRSIANQGQDWKIHKDFFGISEGSENAASGYTFGANVLRYIGPNFYVASGMYYSQKVERVNYDYEINEFVTIDEKAQKLYYTPLPPALRQKVEYDGINTFGFVEMPIKFGTIVSLGPLSNWEVRAEAGLSFMRLINSDGRKPDQTDLSLVELAQNEDLKNSAMGMEVKGGIYYAGVRYFRFGLEPAFAMSVTSLYKETAPTKLRPYNYGFNITANYILFRR